MTAEIVVDPDTRRCYLRYADGSYSDAADGIAIHPDGPLAARLDATSVSETTWICDLDIPEPDVARWDSQDGLGLPGPEQLCADSDNRFDGYACTQVPNHNGPHIARTASPTTLGLSSLCSVWPAGGVR